MGSFTPYQGLVLILLGICKFLSTVVWSLQAPFYPAEAERKNATHFESGIVLGSYEVMVFLMCPFISTQLARIGAFRAFHLGFVLCALSTICFGFLDQVNERITFIGLSIALRLLEATGSSAVFLATYTLTNKIYPGSVATICGIIESTFAVGMAAGPPLGGLLFEAGNRVGFGFTMPFVTIGVLMLLMSMATYTVLPKDDIHPAESMEEITEKETGSPNFGFIALFKVRKIILYSLAGVGASICVGFLTSTLEPHLRQFNLTPSMTGVIFLTHGGIYAVTGFLWGILCDRIRRPEFATLIGSLLVLVSFVFLGPVPSIPLRPSVGLVVTSLAIFGVGLGGLYISVYTLILKEAKSNGFPENSKTSAIVAGLWMEGISLGAFVGPVLGGSLLHYLGFPDASLSIIGILTILSFALALSIFTTKEKVELDELRSKSSIQY